MGSWNGIIEDKATKGNLIIIEGFESQSNLVFHCEAMESLPCQPVKFCDYKKYIISGFKRMNNFLNELL